jgi:hypothetical protein
MAGPVTYSRTPFASTVTVADNGGGPGIEGTPPTIAPIEAEVRQFENDDLDDGTPEGTARATTYVKQQIDVGVFDAPSISAGDNREIGQLDDKKENDSTLGFIDCSGIHQNFDLSTLISPGITLGNFIRDYPRIPGCKQKSVPAQLGLTSDQIVCNLSYLVNRIWIPLKQRFPDLILTNGLRVGGGIGAGPHGTGQAMDIQFQGLSPKTYFERAQWVKNNLPYDQLILEYHTGRGSLVSWLHIGIYKDTGKKVAEVNKVLTMMNHRVRSVGLANLG